MREEQIINIENSLDYRKKEEADRQIHLFRIRNLCDEDYIPKPLGGKCPACGNKLKREKVQCGVPTLIHFSCNSCDYEYVKDSLGTIIGNWFDF